MTGKARKKGRGKKKSAFKRVTHCLHLWLGLGAGIIVFIISITGCIYAFEKEISDNIYKKIKYLPHTPESPVLPLNVLYAQAKKALDSEKEIYHIIAFKDPKRTWECFVYAPGDDNALSFFGTVKYYESLFINPYTGAVTGAINHKYSFFTIIKYIHWSLLLNTRYGQPIIGTGTLIFVVLLGTGLIMWWPKHFKKSTFKKSFTLKFSGKWKRINYDLHNVLGFYALLIALLLALTGLVWAFTFIEKSVQRIGKPDTEQQAPKPFLSDTTLIRDTNALQTAFTTAQNIMPDWQRMHLRKPAKQNAIPPILIRIYDDSETYYNAANAYFDACNGRYLGKNVFKEQHLGEKILRLNYDIHTGAVLGLPGKIIAFLISLICASLPITGFLIWKK